MTSLMIVEPMPIGVTSSRGSGAANLATFDPKEVWMDVAVGSAATIIVDLGSARPIDTIFLGYLRGSLVASSWSITAGVLDAGEQVLQATTDLRVPDASNTFASASHALWTGATVNVRYLAISVTQPAGGAALSAGVLLIGRAFSSAFNHEWGAGRKPIDTATVTALPSGGFSVVEGARKRSLSWTFGDLSTAEVDQLEAIALSRGESAVALVVEYATRSAGLWSRCHYGLFKWRAFERRNRVQTRWEMEIVEWV